MKPAIGFAVSIFLFAASITFSAGGAIHKCVGANGTVAYSDKPCTTAEAATVIKAATKSVREIATATDATSLPAEGKATPNSELQQYDYLCAEDRRLLAIAASKVNVQDTIGDYNLQLHRQRVDKRCNAQGRLAAANRDIELHTLSCKLAREQLVDLKNRPERPAGYSSIADDIAESENWLKTHCGDASGQ